MILIRLFSPIILIRIGPLNSSRIGHFAANTELLITETKLNRNKFPKLLLDLYFCDAAGVSNPYLLKLWKTKIKIIPSIVGDAIYTMQKLIPAGDKFLIIRLAHDRDVSNILDATPPVLQLPKRRSRDR